MTVTSSTNSASYVGNGVSTDFTVPFRFLDNSHLRVVLVDADGTEHVQVLNTDYTASGAGNATGDITFSLAPASGKTVQIFRNVPITQEKDYVTGDKFPAESHEQALDKLTMIAQQQREVLDRAWTSPIGSPGGKVITGAADTAAVFDADGNLVEGPSAAEIENAEGYAEAAAQSATDAANAQTAAETAQGLAEDARDDAQAAASSVQATSFPILSSLDSYHPASAPDFFITIGRSHIFDKGGARWTKTNPNVEPSHAGKKSITLSDGETVVWYEMAQEVVNQFMFGAKGDFAALSGGAMTASDKTLSCASAAFSSADIGKVIWIAGAGTGGGLLDTTIASINNGTSVELTDAAGTTVASAPISYGTDDTDALNALHAFCAMTDAEFLYVHGGHLVTDTVSITTSGDASAASVYANAFDFAGDEDPNVVRIGKTGSNVRVGRIVVRAPYLKNATHVVGDGWSGYDDVTGLALDNLNSCDVYENGVYGFGINVNAGGYGCGAVYDKIYGKDNRSALVCWKFAAKDATGWSNQNRVIGGVTGISAGEDTTNTVLVSLVAPSGASFAGPNNVVFDTVSFEGLDPGYVLVNGGPHNALMNCRFETAGSTPKVRQVSGAHDLKVVGGYGSENIIYSNDGSGAIYGTTVIGTGRSFFQGINEGARFGIYNGSLGSSAYWSAWPSGVNAEGKSVMDTDWLYRLDVFSLKFKTADVAEALISIEKAGFLKFGDGSAAPTKYITNNSGGIAINAAFLPTVNNTYALGNSGRRWSTAYLAAAPDVSSDVRLKENIEDIPDVDKRAAVAIKSLIKRYKLKGGDGRWRYGVIAQEVERTLLRIKIDPRSVGFLNFNDGQNEDGYMSIAYDDLQMLLMAVV